VPGTIAQAERATTGASWDGDVCVSPDGKRIAFVSERVDGHRGLFVRSARVGDPAAPTLLAGGDYDASRPSWSRDSRTVRFTRVDSAGGSTRLFEVDPRSPGAPTQVAVGPPRGAVLEAIESPDGHAWAMVVRGDSTSALGEWSASGGFRPLVDAGVGELPARPTWSRKGEGLVYARGGDLWWIASAGGAPVRLTGGVAHETEPAFSPNGRWLCFVSDSTGVANVWVARFTLDRKRGPALGAWRPATASLQPVFDPAWTPDGHALWFARQDPWFVVARDANLPGQGSRGGPAGAADTLSSSLFDDRSPSFSGDGSHVVFASTRAGAWHLFAMATAGEASSGPAKQLTVGDGPDVAPRWSRASGQIAYVRGGDTLALTDPTGAALGDLGRGRSPAWSPDGRSIVFTTPADSEVTLWALDGVGRTLRPLAAPGVRALDPAWGTGALDGAIVYAAPEGGRTSLWQAAAAGGAPHVITGDPTPGTSDGEPAVAPDGQTVCFTRERHGDRDLWLLSFSTGRARALVVNPRGQDGHAEWSPDGRRIVYETGGAVNLYRADVRPLLLR